MKINYDAKIAVRSKGKFCVKFPKENVDNENFAVGDDVAVSVEKNKKKGGRK